MRKVAKKLKTKYLHGCILYTTNEPCCMCTGAAVWAEMKGIVFGANVRDLEKKFIKEELLDISLSYYYTRLQLFF